MLTLSYTCAADQQIVIVSPKSKNCNRVFKINRQSLRISCAVVFCWESEFFDLCTTLLDDVGTVSYGGDHRGGIAALREGGFSEIGFLCFRDPAYTIGTRDCMGIMNFQLEGMNWTLVAVKAPSAVPHGIIYHEAMG